MSFSFFPSKNIPVPTTEDDAGANPPMQMPNVFVTPPEEEESPAWCFFDADNPTLSPVVENPESPDITVFAYQSEMDSPRYYANPDAMDADIMPRRNIDSVSIVDALIDGQGDDGIDTDTESDYGQVASLEDDPQPMRESRRHQAQARDIRNAADDSDVIEVVKVSRRSRMPDAQSDTNSAQACSGIKPTNTLKSRASKVFRTLKGTLRSKPRAQDVCTPPPVPSLPPLPTYSESESLPRDEAPARPRTPIISRRGSKMLSQLFTAPSVRSQVSVSSFEDQMVTSPTDSVTSPTSSIFSMGDSLSRRPSAFTAAMQDEARLQATSPTPTTSSCKSATRRFSMLSLQKLFTFSSASPAPLPSVVDPPIVPDDSGRTTPIARSITSTPPSVMSSVQTSGPQTPTSSEEVNHVRLVSRKDTADIPGFDSFESVFDTNNGGLNLGLGLGLNLDSDMDVEKTPRKPSRAKSLKSTWEAVAPKRFSRPLPPPSDLDDDGDTSLEMHLDSFHFDDLSFDVNRFVAD